MMDFAIKMMNFAVLPRRAGARAGPPAQQRDHLQRSKAGEREREK